MDGWLDFMYRWSDMIDIRYEKFEVNIFLSFRHSGFDVELSYELEKWFPAEFHFAYANVKRWILNFCFSVTC